MLMILARLVRSESFWAVVKVRSPHTGPEVWYPRRSSQPRSEHRHSLASGNNMYMCMRRGSQSQEEQSTNQC